MESENKENNSVYHGNTESTFIQNHPPPAYTLEPTSQNSTYVGAGTSFSTGVNPVLEPGVHVNAYHHMGPPMAQHHHMGPLMAQHHHNGMVTTVAGGMVITSFTSRPAQIECKSCRAHVLTRCERKAVWKTHFFAMAFCLVCCIPCAIAPYFINDCKNADHYCPECNAYIGSYVI